MTRRLLLFFIYWVTESTIVWGVLWATASNYDETEIKASVVITVMLAVFSLIKSYASGQLAKVFN